MTVSKEGYVAQSGLITKGPYRWVNLNNTAEKIYYVIARISFSVKIGVNTLGFREGGATGLNFAIFTSEVLAMLKGHFQYEPDYLKEQPQAQIAQGTELLANAVSQFSTGNPAAPSSLSPVPQVIPAAPSPSPTKTSVTITSEPSGAEIAVDGQFDSSTPSKLLLSPGEHTIRVTRPGFKSWERKINVEQGRRRPSTRCWRRKKR